MRGSSQPFTKPSLHELEQLALAHHRIVQVQAGKLDLPRVVDLQLVEQPVVERAVVLELQGADRVGDALDRIALPVGEIVHGINAPLVAGAVVETRAGCGT